MGRILLRIKAVESWLMAVQGIVKLFASTNELHQMCKDKERPITANTTTVCVDVSTFHKV